MYTVKFQSPLITITAEEKNEEGEGDWGLVGGGGGRRVETCSRRGRGARRFRREFQTRILENMDTSR